MLEVPYRIPWLIWIQLIVLLLLLALLFFFTVDLALDLDAGNTVAVTSPATASTSTKVFIFDEIEQIDKPVITSTTTNHVITNSQRLMQGGGENLTIKSEIRTDSSTSMRREEIMDGEASSLSFHFCHYFECATVAFLKCFGLDSTSDTSSNRKRTKRKES